MERPRRAPPQWAGSAPDGRISEPLEGEATVGYTPGEAPPAQWWNYSFNQIGQWLGWLSGPSLSTWFAAGYPDPAGSTAPLRMAVDTTTADGDEAAYRYVIATSDGTGAMVLVSRHGDEWVTRRNLPSSPGTPVGIVCDGSYFVLWTDTGVYSSPVDNFSTSPIRDVGTPWSGPESIRSGGGVVADLVLTGSHPFASSSTAILVQGTGGFYFDKLQPSWRQAGRAICCTAAGSLVELSSDAGDGVVSRADPTAVASGSAATLLAAWSHTQTLTGATTDTTWRLAVGEVHTPSPSTSGPVVAAYKTGTDAPQIWTSLDDGVTWNAVTTTAALKRLTSMTWSDGTWVATSTVFPYAWSSSDLESWVALPLPVGEAGNALMDVAAANGRWLLAGRPYALRGAPAVDPSPGPFVAGTQASIPGNAGWLRGRKISVAAPGDGQVLVWNEGAQLWVPTTPSAGSTVPWTAALAPAETRTTDDTVTTIKSIATTTNKSHLFRVEVLASKGDRSAAWGVSALLVATNAAGSVTVSAAIALGPATIGSSIVDATTPIDFDVSGTNVRVRAKGTAATTVDWDVSVTSIVGGGA